MRNSNVSRRKFLKATGVCLALPVLESFPAQIAKVGSRPQRLVCIGTFLGFYQNAFFPKQSGRDYELAPLLEPIANHRNDFTVFSGLDHRSPNGHGAWSNFLCGNKPESYSLDQRVADVIGHETRFPSIQLSAGKASRTMSHTRQGVAPHDSTPVCLLQQTLRFPRGSRTERIPLEIRPKLLGRRPRRRSATQKLGFPIRPSETGRIL